MRRFRSFNHSACKTVLNLLETVYLGLRKIEVERVTVVKFRVDIRVGVGAVDYNVCVALISSINKWRYFNGVTYFHC